MKGKIKSIISILVVVLLTVGCSSGKKSGDNANSANAEKDEFKATVETQVPLSEYVISGGSEETKDSYMLKGDQQKDYEFDFVISLDNNAKIAMPMAFKDFSGQGWELASKNDSVFPLKPGCSTDKICKYKDKEIKVYSINSGSENSTFGEGNIYRVSFDLYSADDGYSKELKSAPEFKIFKDINNNSDMNEVVKALGNPTQIKKEVISDDCSKIVLLYQNKTSYDNLEFEFTSDGSKIVSVDYSVDPKE